MDVVNLLSAAVEQLDGSECGFCFDLIVGGREDFFNNKRDRTPENTGEEPCECELCCVQVGLFSCKFRDVIEVSSAGINKAARDWDLQIFFGAPSKIDIQFFDEVEQDKIQQSKWVKYLHPLQCCINGLDINLCDVYDTCGGGCGHTLEIRSWSGEMKIDYLDRNFDGWLITTTIRECIS